MKTKICTIIVLSILAFAAAACSFTTANISSFNFGKNDTATPPATTFNVGEKVYAVANVSNAMGKYKVRYKLTYENVAGKDKGESAGTQDVDIDGSSTTNFFFTTPLPGEYKVEVSLLDDQGKEIGKKSGNITVKGSAPTATTSTDTKKDDSADHDSEDK